VTFFSPATLNDIAGNQAALDTLRAILDKPELAPRAYILDGPSGVGKTTVGQLFLKNFGKVTTAIPTVLAFDNDFECILVENVDTIADVSHLVELIDSQDPFVCMTTMSYFKLPSVLKSRAYRVSLSNLTKDALAGLIIKACAEHKLTYTQEGVMELVKLSEGNPGKALTHLNICALKGALTLDNIASETRTIEQECHSALTALPNVPEAIRIVTDLSLHYPPEEIINKLFTAYSVGYFQSTMPEILAGMHNITTIFLKWHSINNLPKESLPLLIKELSEAHLLKNIVQTSIPVSGIKTVAPPRELGGRELARAMGASIGEG